MDFSFTPLPSATPSMEAMYDTCVDARMVLQKRCPYGVMSHAKKIILGDLDAFHFEDLAGFVEELYEAHDHGLTIPIEFGQIHTLAYHCSADKKGNSNPLHEAARNIHRMANYRGFLEPLPLFFPGLMNINLIIDDKNVAFSEDLEGFVSGPWRRIELILGQHKLLDDAEEVKRQIESIFDQENTYAVQTGKEPYRVRNVTILARTGHWSQTLPLHSSCLTGNTMRMHTMAMMRSQNMRLSYRMVILVNNLLRWMVKRANS